MYGIVNTSAGAQEDSVSSVDGDSIARSYVGVEYSGSHIHHRTATAVPFRSVPVPFRSVPSRSVPCRAVPFRSHQPVSVTAAVRHPNSLPRDADLGGRRFTRVCGLAWSADRGLYMTGRGLPGGACREWRNLHRCAVSER